MVGEREDKAKLIDTIFAEAAKIFKDVGAEGELQGLPRVRSLGEEITEKRKLMALFKVGQMISSELDFEKLLSKIMDAAIEVLGAQRGFLLLYDKATERAMVKVARNAEEKDLDKEEFEFSRRIIKEVVDTKKPIVITDAQAEKRFRISDSIIKYGLKSILAVPMVWKDNIVGVIYLDNKLVARLFAESDLEVAEVIASQAAVSIENARAYKKIDDFNKNLAEKVEQRTKELRMKSEQLQVSNDQLLEASRAKSEFISHVSHDLRSPLTAIIGYAELVEKDTFGKVNAKIIDAMQTIKRCSNHLLSIIGDILDLSKSEVGKLELFPEDFLVKDCLDTVFASIRPLADYKKLKLKQKVGNDVAVVYGDLKRVTQILINILGNAVKFTDKGEINLEVKSDDKNKEYLFIINDTGKGIPDDKKDKVFAIFERANLDQEGTGLGMSIAKKLVEKHGGRIWFESKLNKGTTFYFTLPAKHMQTHFSG